MPLQDLMVKIASRPTPKRAFKYWYPLVTRVIGSDEVVFLNWSYEEDPPMALPLEASDERNRAYINLYHRVATQVDLTGKKVLEVSCGHGGGASYLTRTQHPASYTGLDVNKAGLAIARKNANGLPGLDFVHGDAEQLPFEDQSFDVVLNIEASHCYPHFERFLSEVARVLRPGGHFLFADIRVRGFLPTWDQQLAESPLREVSQKDINEQVVLGLESNTQGSRDMIKSNLPAFLRAYGREIAAVKGTIPYRYLQKGRVIYRMYCFTKD